MSCPQSSTLVSQWLHVSKLIHTPSSSFIFCTSIIAQPSSQPYFYCYILYFLYKSVFHRTFPCFFIVLSVQALSSHYYPICMHACLAIRVSMHHFAKPALPNTFPFLILFCITLLCTLFVTFVSPNVTKLPSIK